MELINIQEKPFGISIIPNDDINGRNYLSKIGEISKEISQFRLEILFKNGINALVRGTCYDNIQTVLNTGVDVVPSNSPIFCTPYSDKAMEYGWDDRNNTNRIILLFYDSGKLERTFKEISSDTPKCEIEELIQLYPTIEYSRDGNRIWLSRLQKNDTRRTTDYEYQYAYWIPEDPFNALVWVLLLGSFSQQEICELNEKIKTSNS